MNEKWNRKTRDSVIDREKIELVREKQKRPEIKSKQNKIFAYYMFMYIKTNERKKKSSDFDWCVHVHIV